jgi:hypothetical protein
VPEHSSVHLSVYLLHLKCLEHPSTHAGMCYAIKPGIIVDTYGHVLLGSYWLVHKVSPSVGVSILSSLRIPLLGA